jgi:arsenate reductase-like glutaredoxin family protein
METILKKEFWKHASMLVEMLINNPIKKFNHEDLLDDIPKDECLYKALPKLPDFHLKSSSLDTSYKTYDPRIMEVMQRSKKIEALTSIRKNARTPSVPSRTIKVYKSKEEKKSFSISYKKKSILGSLKDGGKAHALPNINSRLKEFISKVQEKYAKLVKALEFKQETLSFDAIIGYLKKSHILLKRPTYTRDRQRAYSKSPPGLHYNHHLVPMHQEDISLGIGEKMLLLSVCFI